MKSVVFRQREVLLALKALQYKSHRVLAFALTRLFNMLYMTPFADINSWYEDERAHIARETSDH